MAESLSRDCSLVTPITLAINRQASVHGYSNGSPPPPLGRVTGIIKLEEKGVKADRVAYRPTGGRTLCHEWLTGNKINLP